MSTFSAIPAAQRRRLRPALKLSTFLVAILAGGCALGAWIQWRQNEAADTLAKAIRSGISTVSAQQQIRETRAEIVAARRLARLLRELTRTGSAGKVTALLGALRELEGGFGPAVPELGRLARGTAIDPRYESALYWARIKAIEVLGAAARSEDVALGELTALLPVDDDRPEQYLIERIAENVSMLGHRASFALPAVLCKLDESSMRAPAAFAARAALVRCAGSVGVDLYEVRPAIIDALVDEHPMVRWSGITAIRLWWIHHEGKLNYRATTALIDVLEQVQTLTHDPNDDVRRLALETVPLVKAMRTIAGNP